MRPDRRQREHAMAGIDGDLGLGQNVGKPGPCDPLRQTGVGRGDPGDGTPDGREHHTDRAGRAGWLGLHRRPVGHGEASTTQRRGAG